MTWVPESTGLTDAAIDTLTVAAGLTWRVIWFEVAGFPLVHARPDVRMQETISLSEGK